MLEISRSKKLDTTTDKSSTNDEDKEAPEGRLKMLEVWTRRSLATSAMTCLERH